MRTLLLAWAGAFAFLGTVAMWMQLSYSPPAAPADMETPADAAGQTDSPEGSMPQSVQDSSADSPMDAAPSGQMADADRAESGRADASAAGSTAATQPGDGSSVDRSITRPNFGDTPDEGEDSMSDIVEQAPEPTEQYQTPAGPDASLVEDGPYGPLPITWNQRQPWQAYARPFDRPSDRPRIAIIITGMGLSQSTTERAINTLPPDVTLAFSPYGQNLQSLADQARQAGHESLLMVPMEPLDYPANDPGPRGLMTDATQFENEDKLHFVLAQMQGYVGLINDMGSKFTASPEAMAVVMQDIQRRGLVFVDAHTSRLTVAATSAREYGVPRALNDRYIDNDVSPAQINRYLRELENIAVRNGVAIGIGRPYPITMDQIAAWAPTLAARGIDLAPITAVANRQALR